MNLKRKTNQLVDSASNGRIPIRAFDNAIPAITRQIRQDANSKWLDSWGQSLNFDEYEKATIVDPKILSTIGRIANHPIRDGRSYHAGLMHTYGYLLSNLKTRYGFKRERWTNGLLESSFGLPKGMLSSSPVEGTLLQNVSYVMSQISFSKSTTVFAKTANAKTNPLLVPESLAKIRFDRLPTTRISEVVTLPNTRQRLKIYMDIVKFKRSDPLESFMVYSTELRSTQQLITCFPMSTAVGDELIVNAKKNETLIRPRFNLSFPGFPVAGLKGKRTVSKRA
ncbi:MAG: hypothetical protein AB8B55_06555 [Mariniblastus sp.]